MADNFQKLFSKDTKPFSKNAHFIQINFCITPTALMINLPCIPEYQQKFVAEESNLESSTGYFNTMYLSWFF